MDKARIDQRARSEYRGALPRGSGDTTNFGDSSLPSSRLVDGCSKVRIVDLPCRSRLHWPLRLYMEMNYSSIVVDRSWIRSISALGATILLQACAGIQGYPAQSSDPTIELSALAPYFLSSVMEKYESEKDSDRRGLTKRQWRNQVIEARIRAVNIRFGEFEQTLYEQGIGFGVGTDWTVLALTTAGAISTGNAPKYFSAAAALVTGAKVSYDKNVLYEKTMPVILSQMQAGRQSVLVRIRQGEAQEVDSYPLPQGLSDVDDYYRAGTIPTSISGLATNAGAQLQAATKELGIISVGVVPKDLQIRRENLAEYLKKLSASEPAKLNAIATSRGISVAPADTLGALLSAIAAAKTVPDFDKLAQSVKILTGQEF